VPATFLIYLRQYRRPIVVIAAGLVVLQGMLAGLATAQAAALAANSFTAVICHGAGDADPADGGAPNSGKIYAVCCAFCTAAASALTPGQAMAAGRFDLGREPAGPALSRAVIALDPRAVRAGSSQAPPSSST
jgi:hypothetical protein